MTTYPAKRAASFTPLAKSVKNGFEMSGTTSPKIRVFPARKVCAEAFGINFNSSIAFRTFFNVSGARISGRLMAFETVPNETPAFSATRRIPVDMIETIQHYFQFLHEYFSR